MTTGTGSGHSPMSSHAATQATYAVTKPPVPRLVHRAQAHAAAKPATRYMLSMSRWPPHSLWVACMAAEPGPSSTTTHAKRVATPVDITGVASGP